MTRFLRCRAGSTAIEYATIACLVSIVIVAAATSMGTQLKTFFARVSGAFG